MSAAPTPAVDIAEPVWSAALAAIETAGEVALACHVAPDGDALGSMLALGLALRARGVPVRCGFAGSPQVPATYSYLPGQELLVGEADFPAAPALLVTLDTSSVDRLGVRLDADIATCVYTGLTTDTGSFKYAATTPAVHDLARRLLETGIAHDRVARAIWDTHPYGYVRLLGLACSRARLEPAEVSGLGLVWTWTTAADLREHGIGIDEVEAVIDVVRTTAEAEVAVVVKEDLDGALKVSTRSKGRVDVGAVCAALGGGGHRFAAGFTSPDDLSRTLERLREMLAEVGPLAG